MKPYDTKTRRQTERAILGTVLAEPGRVADFDGLEPDDFGAAGYRAIWCAVVALRLESAPLTIAAVAAWMRRAGTELADLGGISTEADFESALAALVPEAEPEHAVEYSRGVRAMAANQRLAERLTELAKQANVWPPQDPSFYHEALEGLRAGAE
jgi:replicative DNA helicase